LIVSIVLVFYLVSQSLPFESTETYDEPYNLQKNENLHYMIVIDAGSTGSRIHVFKLFHDETLSSKKFDIKLLNEVLFVKTKPGLSSFANEPEKAIQTIQPLLNRAFEIIPNEYRRRARVSLKATAGLRMISKKASQIILESIDKLFDEYPFISDSKDLGILDGKYEGIYSWVTLNYALKTFEISGESETCSLDLGGGSTQITFIPSGIVTGQEKDYLVDFLVDKTRYSIYAKSFLGYGLMSARMNMFNHDLHNSLNRTELGGLSSVCVPHGTRFKWFQQGIEYTVNGARSKELNTFENCFKIALKTLTNNIKAPVELKDKRIYAFSFYYDRLKSANLLEITNVLKLSEIQKKAAES